MADPMVVESASSLVETLRRHRLLEAAQLEELALSRKSLGNAHTLARDLVGRGWLTAYQANQLLAGRAAGLILGPYIVLERLGEGATGQVFKARHVHMRRVVAVKVIRPDLLSDSEIVARFYREIQVISRLTHPHVVHAYDAGPVGRTHFLAMELVEGINLADLVQQQGILHATKACDYVRQAALGLQHAHEKGLVHRDIKPSNLILTQTLSARSLAEVDLGSKTLVHGIVKVLDLGLARLPRNADEGHNPLTLAGRGMMGTPDYLAPEQALDLRQADIRSDLYSLGCVLYFLLVGKPPFPGGTLAQKLMKHQQAPPPDLAQKRPGLPSDLDGIYNRLLSKDPAQRYQTPAELATALAPLGGTLVIANPACDDTLPLGPPVMSLPFAVPVSRGPRIGRNRVRKLGYLTGILLLAGLLGGLGLVLSRQPSAALSTETAGDTEEFESAALRPLAAQWRRYRDGVGDDPEPIRQSLLAVIRNHGGLPDALQAARMLKEMPSPLDRWFHRPTPLPQGLPSEVAVVLGDSAGQSWTEVTCLAVSPTGKLVAGGGSDGVVRVWNAETLRETAVLRGDGAAIQGLAWAADGLTLAAADTAYHVRLWNLAKATPQVEATLELPAAYVNGVAFASTGKWLAAANADGKVHLWQRGGATAGKEFGTISGSAGWAHAVAFSPDGATLAAGFANGTVELWDMAVPKPRGRYVLKGHEGPVRSISYSGDGKTLACLGDRLVRLWSVEDLPRAVSNITSKYRIPAAVLAPDGKTLAVVTQYPPGIDLWDATASPPRKMGGASTGPLGQINTIGFSPTGKALFSGGQDRTVRHWDVTNVPPREIRPGAGSTLGPLSALALSFDGRFLATHVKSEAFLQRWEIDGPSHQSRGQVPLGSTRVGRIVFAPDGKHLAVVTTWQPSIWALDGPKPRALTLPSFTGRAPTLAFTPDGRSVAIAHVGSPPGLCFWQLDRKPKEATEWPTPAGLMGSLSFTPDGKELATVGPADQKVHFWAVGSATPSQSQLAEKPLAVGFGPDGKMLAILNGKNGQAELWDRSTANPQRRLSLGGPPLGRVRSLDFSPDGRLLVVSGDGPEPVSLWELPSGRKLRSWSLPGPVFSVDFTQDGRHFLTLNGNATAYLFRIAPPPIVTKR